jgi:hypothetical protein
MTIWPLQSQRNSFYGNPTGKHGQASEKWKAANLVYFYPPFRMTYAGQPVKKFLVHRKIYDSINRVFGALWIASGKSQAELDRVGVSIFGGCFNYRLSVNSNNLSSHSWACALDLAPSKYPNKQKSKRFPAWVVKCFTDEGAINLLNDPMHFQWARLG